MCSPAQHLILIKSNNDKVTKDLVAKILNQLHEISSQGSFECPVLVSCEKSHGRKSGCTQILRYGCSKSSKNQANIISNAFLRT